MSCGFAHVRITDDTSSSWCCRWMSYSFTSCGPMHRLRHRRPVAHREDLAARPDVFLRVAVAVEAPLHLQRVLLQHQRHLVDAPVAGLAADALLHVDAVVEVDEVGQVVHARPLQRLVVAEAGAHRLEDRRVRPDLRVAVHAGLGRRDAGERRRLDRRVAVAAVDAVVEHVVLVAELHRLLDELAARASRTTSGRGSWPAGSGCRPASDTPARLTLERVLALRRKICGIGC